MLDALCLFLVVQVAGFWIRRGCIFAFISSRIYPGFYSLVAGIVRDHFDRKSTRSLGDTRSSSKRKGPNHWGLRLYILSDHVLTRTRMEQNDEPNRKTTAPCLPAWMKLACWSTRPTATIMVCPLTSLTAKRSWCHPQSADRLKRNMASLDKGILFPKSPHQRSYRKFLRVLLPVDPGLCISSVRCGTEAKRLGRPVLPSLAGRTALPRYLARVRPRGCSP